MKKTYITTMPNHIGAFLKASRCFASLGINITRVSYNKAVDSHTLFIDAEGSEDQLRTADKMLAEIGYLNNTRADSSIVLLEFRLRDVPGSVTDVLSLINEFNFNISYISSQENGTDHQLFKMGLYVDDPQKISEFLESAEKLCRVKVIDYNHSEKVYDNSIFYNSFVRGIARTIGLSEKVKNDLLISTNLAMQTLDEAGLSPYKTFDSISRFADMLAKYVGEAFSPRISRHKVTENTEVVLIEPPCGSNTAIIKSFDEYLFIDGGYALYANETKEIIKRLIPAFDEMKKTAFLTHADVDHCGILSDFDEIYMTKDSAECLRLEREKENGFREKNPLHKPYIDMCKILTAYKTLPSEPIRALWGRADGSDEPLVQVGFFKFGELSFEVYEGNGGHLRGEAALIDYTHRIAFTGDIYVNLKGMTGEQAEYNRYAPILMTSVDTDPKLCAAERRAIMNRLGVGEWQIFGGHGAKKDYSVGTGDR